MEVNKPDQNVQTGTTEGSSAPYPADIITETKRTDKRRAPMALSNNALTGAIIAGIISLVVTLTTNHVQNQHEDVQGRSQQQSQAMSQLQTAAGSEFDKTMIVYKFERQCVGKIDTWLYCAHLSPGYDDFNIENTQFGISAENVSDSQSTQLAFKFVDTCINMIDASSPTTAENLMPQATRYYAALVARLGKLIRQ